MMSDSLEGSAEETSSSDHADATSSEPAFLADAGEDQNAQHSSTYTKLGRLRYSTLKAYCEILKDTVTEAESKAGVTEPALSASLIGATHWTCSEKDAFFSNLERYGRMNLPAIATAIGSKSIPEVQQYMLALEEGLDHYHDNAHSRRGPKFVHNPAAVDIDADCELSLDVVAETLEQYLHQRMCDAAKSRYGEDWIIDEERANRIEGQIEQTATPDSDDDVKAEVQHDEGSTTYASARLLKPISFILLSRNTFMNGNTDDSHYDKLQIITEGSSGPSVLRSAFDMFHDICLDYTKRLVHAAHFQAMTRLRSDVDDRRSAVVGPADVHQALDIMRIEKPDSVRYWADVVERYGLEVYAHTKRHKHEDHHDRYDGFKLEKGEARKILMKVNASSPEKGPSSSHDIRASRQDSFAALDRHSTPSEHESSQNTADELIQSDDDSSEYASSGNEMSSSDEYEMNRDAYLEGLDQENNQREGNALRHLLRLSEQHVVVHEVPKPHGDLQNAAYVKAWHQCSYASEWERPSGALPKSAFEQAPERKRRRKG